MRENKFFGNQGEEILQTRYGTKEKALKFYQNQMLDHLNPLMQEFLQRQDFFFLSTSDSEGNCDSSFRSGSPGFIKILDEKTLCFPDYEGNGVMASLGNILENPHAGLIFIDFFKDTIGLHVNGNAEILKHIDNVTDSSGKAKRWVKVIVEEAYIHCSKYIPLLKRLHKEILWGTNDPSRKGGDYFKVPALR